MDAKNELLEEVTHCREAEVNMQAEVCHFKNEEACRKHIKECLEDEKNTAKCLQVSLQAGGHPLVSPPGINRDLNLEDGK